MYETKLKWIFWIKAFMANPLNMPYMSNEWKFDSWELHKTQEQGCLVPSGCACIVNPIQWLKFLRKYLYKKLTINMFNIYIDL